jgi:hypothetical protein
VAFLVRPHLPISPLAHTSTRSKPVRRRVGRVGRIGRLQWQYVKKWRCTNIPLMAKWRQERGKIEARQRQRTVFLVYKHVFEDGGELLYNTT